MKRIKAIAALLTISAFLEISSPSANAAALLFDFGPTTVTAADATKSPTHYLGVLSATATNWNQLQADTNFLVYADGTTATGISIDLGMEYTPGAIDLNNNTFNATLSGSAINTGVYAGTSPARDGFFGINPNNRAVGIRVNGLPAGTYTVYLVGRNSNAIGENQMRFYAKSGASASTFPYSVSDTYADALNPNPAVTNGFFQGTNFVVLTKTITAGESLYLAAATNGVATTSEARGFINCLEIYFGVPVLPARIASQPAPTTKTVNEGVTVTFAASTSGDEPITRQWQLNTVDLTDGAHINGATTNTLRLIRPLSNQAGNYALAVNNSGGGDLSSNAVLTINPMLNTAQMSNIWNLLPGDRTYLGVGDTERGLAYNSVTTNLLLVSRNPSLQIAVLDALTGAEKRFLNISGVSGGTFAVSTIGVGDDGAVFGVGLTTAASGGNPLKIYRWADDDASTVPGAVFIGDPASAVQPGVRWGDTMTMRGAGANTQILLSPGTGTNVVLLRTISGSDFQTEILPLVIAVSNAPSAFARKGLAFGPSTNTFWGKNNSGQLYLIQFDINTGTGFVLQSYSTAQVPAALTGLAMDKTRNLLAGVSLEAAGDNVRVYDVSSLAAGALLRDQETFEVVNANSQQANALAFGGNYLFALDSNNGIKAFKFDNSYVPPSVSIVTHPANKTILAGRPASFSAAAASPDPITYRWRFNNNNLSDGPNISGATTNVLNLLSVTTNDAGNYSLFVTNVNGSAVSSNAVLTVIPTFNTTQMTNIWNLLPGARDYLNTGATERSLAYNPVTTNLLVATRTPTVRVAVLDALTGAEKHFLDMSGVAGGTYDLNQIAVADDGAIIGAGLTTTASSPSLRIYRWANDSPSTVPTLVFDGDPAGAVQPNLRWGDVMAVRGGGGNTQILLAPSSGTNVVLLLTVSGTDFQTEIPPTVIPVTGVPSGFAKDGIAIGAGANEFWGKSVSGALYLIQVNLNTVVGAAIYTNSTTLPAVLTSLATDPTRRLLAGVSLDTFGDSVLLYDVTDLNNGTVLADQEAFATKNANSLQLAALTFGANYLFALDVNNGIKAFRLNALSLASFSITSVGSANGSVVFTWPTVAGHNYQVQYRGAVPGNTWTNLGSAVTATGSALSFTNSMSGAATRFYRIEAQ